MALATGKGFYSCTEYVQMSPTENIEINASNVLMTWPPHAHVSNCIQTLDIGIQ